MLVSKPANRCGDQLTLIYGNDNVLRSRSGDRLNNKR